MANEKEQLYFDAIRQIQQINRWRWELSDERLKQYNEKRIIFLVENHKEKRASNLDADDKRLHGSGTGLVLLSHLTKDCLCWDEVLSLS